MRHLVAFDCVVKHDFSSAECKNLKKTYATLIFKVSEVDGSVKTKSIEVNLEELKQFREEILRIEEALS
jgi:COMM domain